MGEIGILSTCDLGCQKFLTVCQNSVGNLQYLFQKKLQLFAPRTLLSAGHCWLCSPCGGTILSICCF